MLPLFPFLLFFFFQFHNHTATLIVLTRAPPLPGLRSSSSPLTEPLACGSRKVLDTGVYLVENGLEMVLYIGQNASAEWIQQVLGKDSFASVETQGATIPTFDSPLNQAVRRILDLVRQERGRFMPVRALAGTRRALLASLLLL